MHEREDWYLRLLEAMTSIQARLFGRLQGGSLFEELLASLLKLTRSEYGFIGEIEYDDNGSRFLRTHAITDIAWNEETRRFYNENIANGLEFRNLDTLFGAVMKTEAPVLSNSPSTDPRRGGLPAGHPDLDSFFGFPLHSGGSMVGMLGVANRPGGYDEALLRALDPLLQTCANAIFSFRADNHQRQAEAQLHDEQARVRAMLDGVFDGIVTIDEGGLVESVNPAAERMFGRRQEEIAGRNISLLMPEYLELGSATILDVNRALDGRRRTGEEFPVEVRVTEVSGRERRLFTAIIRDTSKEHEAEETVERLTAEVEHYHHYGQMIGRSVPMKRLYQLIEEVAEGGWPVLIEGETGVGKELVARAIHAAGSPRHRPFVATNIAGLTDSLAASQLFGHRRGAFTGAQRDQKGLFQAADGGTLFLDELGHASEIVQTALLRVLEEGEIVPVGDVSPRKVNVRVICATSGILRDRLERGQFRQDLLYRLQVARVGVPPLRERAEDIPLLAEAFLAEARAATGRGLGGFTPEAMRRLTDYDWPGNVRELRNAVDYVAIHCRRTVAGIGDLPPEIAEFSPSPSVPAHTTSQVPDERAALQAALDECGGNRTRAAQRLGVSRATLYRKLAAFGLASKWS
jgi:PAS domain S-box-containing protein